MDLGTLPTRNARHYPAREALIFEGLRLTWSELNARINRAANALLGLGVRKGGAVALLLPNCPELVELYWAVAKIGAVAVPLSPLLRGPGLAALLRDSGAVALVTNGHLAGAIDGIRAELTGIPAARMLVTDEAGRPGFGNYAALAAAASAAEPPPSGVTGADPYNIFYSSGTTGEPKGVVHHHDHRARYALAFSGPFRFHGQAVVLQSSSLVFNGSMLMFIPWMYNAATLVVQRKFDAGSYLDTVVRERVTHGMLVPSQIVALLGHPAFTAEALASFETLLSVGAPLHLEHKLRLTAIKAGFFCELYGLTEGGCTTVLDRADVLRKPGSVGTPMPLAQMKIVGEDGRELPPGAVGEIVGSSHTIMAGYHNRPELTAATIRDGWVHTGDLGYLDEEGFLYLVDRKKDMIVSGGVNVYPKDIEEVVVRHPAVREAAVFGVPDPKWGEVPHCAVTLLPGAAATTGELLDWVNARVAAGYQKIREVSIHDDFPRNAAGKTLKRDLRAPYWEGRTASI